MPFDNLPEGTVTHGFRTTALYLDDADKPMGARFIHEQTGFTFDLLQIQSVPQAFMWVNSFPTSDMGEPHTQEHLLLGKGNKGRYVSNLEDMSLGGSNAFTQQTRTCYHFNTGAGAEVFYRLLEDRIDALLHPDYSNEEIRREVCNFGVTQNPADSTLRIEEKGTVYNEMVSSFERPWSRLSRALDIALYGANHPLAYVSGGLPSAIRTMQPRDIRTFHREHYFLGNMGMIGSFPNDMPLDDILARTDAILMRLGATGTGQNSTIVTEATLPKPAGAPAGTSIMVEYPSRNEAQPGPLVFAWPAQLSLAPKERSTLQLFIDNIAGDATTNLYKLFIDTRTRTSNLGATGVFGWVSSDQGQPVMLGLSDYPPAAMTKAKVATVRAMIVKELKRIAAWKDGSPELKEFNGRMLNQITGTRRELAKFVNSPPGFGFRNTGSGWMSHLDDLNKTPGFRKSVTLKSDLDAIEQELGNGRNIWREYIKRWKLIESVPYAAAARPSAALIQHEEHERIQRVAAEIARLKQLYNVSDEQEAIRRYATEYDATTAALDRTADGAARVPFIDSPPLTLDDQLDYRVTTAAGVPMVASTFDNMTSATVGIALRLDAVTEQEMVYLSLLPGLLTGVGIKEDATAISYEEMTEKLRQEILGLNAYFSSNARTGRVELVVRGAGNDLAETEKSIMWMRRVLTSPYWADENLPRIRDMVDQALSGFRNTMQGREEAWVNDPPAAYRRQDNRLLLATRSFLTQAHNAHRLRWLLKDAGTQKGRDAIAAFLDDLASAASASRDDLQRLLGAIKGETAENVKPPLQSHLHAFKNLPTGAKALAIEAARDLGLTLADIPDGSLRMDWAYLCAQIRHDLLVPPSQTLHALTALRKRILHASNARMFMIGSRAHQEKLAPAIDALVGDLQTTQTYPATPVSLNLVDARLRERMPEAAHPVFVALVNPSTGSGVFVNSAPSIGYNDIDRESLLDYMTAQIFGGGGSHGIFMKTWGAGLAYSNGIGSSPTSGRINYYAERCPELPQTIRFVIDEIRKAPIDTGLADYVVAQTFREFRSPSGYETRGEAMANDLADGVTPDMVSRFRRAILAMRNTPELMQELYQRREKVYGTILPGYGPAKKDVQGGVYFVIGPDKQLELYQQYLKKAEGADATLYRLYPRDFWMPLQAVTQQTQRN